MLITVMVLLIDVDDHGDVVFNVDAADVGGVLVG